MAAKKLKSLPVWERGLKADRRSATITFLVIAPRVGAWIERMTKGMMAFFSLSLPVWERGLKEKERVQGRKGKEIAPRVGAWIESWKASSHTSKPN